MQGHQGVGTLVQPNLLGYNVVASVVDDLYFTSLFGGPHPFIIYFYILTVKHPISSLEVLCFLHHEAIFANFLLYTYMVQGRGEKVSLCCSLWVREKKLRENGL